MAEIPAADEAPVQDGSDVQVQKASPATLDPLYGEMVALMQEGRWQEAVSGLHSLEQRYATCPELETARQHLSLHLSAEESWAPPGGSGPALLEMPSVFRTPAVRLLLLANLLLYLLLGFLLLLARFGVSSL
jgi:hypothetical protein